MQSTQSHVPQGAAPPPPPPPMQSVGSGQISVNGTNSSHNSSHSTHGQVAAANMQHTQYQPQPQQYQHHQPQQQQQQQPHHQQHQQPQPHQQPHQQQHTSHQQPPPPHQQHQSHQQHQQHQQPPQPHQQHQQHQQPQQHQHHQQLQQPPPQQHQQYSHPPPPQQQQQQQHRNSYTQPHQQQGPPPQQLVPPPQQQHHYPHQGLNGGWQSDKDYQERRKMIAKIVHLLQQRKPNAPQEWLKKLPQMAKRLEESLYRSAKSFEQYNDASTLKHRLQQLAVNIGMKTKKMQQAQMAQQKLQQQPPPPQQPQQYNQQPPPSQYMQPPTQQPQVHRAPAPQPVQARPPGPQPIQQRPHQPMQQQPQVQHAPPPPQPQHQQQPQQQRIVNVAEINPIMGGSQQSQPLPPAPPPPLMQQTSQPLSSQSIPQTNHVQYQPQPQHQQAPPPSAPVIGTTQPAPGQNGARPTADLNRQVSDRQQVLRHQQQRLLLLRHAAKCQHEDGRCPVTPHCAGMKRLWKHIAECKDQKCLVPHCVSSRYVLSHYHRCKDVRCPVCGPVREAIHRSHEKQKQMQALKQRHQQAVQQNQIPAASASVSAPAPVAPAPITQPIPSTVPIVAPSSIAPVSSTMVIEQPPAKRQRTDPVMPGQPYPPVQPGSAPIVQHQPPVLQPPTAISAMPPQPPGVPQPTQYQYAPSQTSAASMPPQPSTPAIAPVPVPGTKPAAVQPGPGRPRVPIAPGIAFQNGQVITPKYTGPKPQEDHTLINCFSVDQIETHIASLNKGLQLPPQKLKNKCLEVLKVLQSHQHGWVFNSPVDPVELGLPDYFEVIKRPMDLGTIRKKLENGCYHTLEEFEGHVHLTFDNAMLYNPQGSVVYNMAEEMKAKFVQDYAVLIKQLNAEEDAKRTNGEACLLCGCEKLIFEPPVFYCNGANCPSKRIRRNSYYYVGGNNQYHWCHQCFQELKDNQTIELGDITVKKEALVKKKNDEVHEESWVQCDRCERWIHQICALFNTRQNKDQRSEYACPRCTIEERRKKGQLDPISTTPMAEDLPRTTLSQYLEEHVRKKVDEYIEKNSQAKARAEQIPIEEARKALQMGGHITIRQVTSMDRKLEVRERMKRRYAFKNYPDEFNFRCKCIVVFQNLDGVDVILFGLYVYEHDENNPEPNKRTVYISYLDSVYYMRPRKMRTFIYHEILISYLDYVRNRGFSSAHIWACPPLKGDDYILYAKPEDQKVPKDDRLRQWYIDMLVESQKRGIVGTVTNMYDLYFSNEKNDATVVPYMDGDYFPAEVENIIKDIEEGKTGKKGSSQGKKKKQNNNKAKQKKKSGRGGTRSTGLDEQALKASGFLPPGSEFKSVEEGGRDYVMVKLGETIQPMKESFIVAFLAWEGAKPEHMVVPKEIEVYRKQHGIVPKFDQAHAAAATSDGGDKPKSDEEKPPGEESEEKKESSEAPAVNSPTAVSVVKEENDNQDSMNVDQASGEHKIASETPNDKSVKVKEEVKDEPMPDASPKEETKSLETAVNASDGNPNQDTDPATDPSPADPSPAPAPQDSSTGAAEADKPDGNSNAPSSTPTPAPSDAAPAPAPVATNGSSDSAQTPASAPAPNTDSAPTQASTTAPAGAPTDAAAPAAANSPAPANAPAPGSVPATVAAPVAAPSPSLGPSPTPGGQNAMAIREGKFAAMAARKRDLQGNTKETEEEKEKEEEEEEKKKPSKSTYVKDGKGRLVKVIDDDEEEMDCEFLNNRQAFLNLCQGNHYQFDQLRRAKHSSMMVLWHLHNRDAPKFVQQCATCSREILTGFRYHCPTCADFDQCQECVQNPKVARHPHQLKPIPVASGQQPELTEEQRKERQRSIQLHMTLLQHAATCTSTKCPSANCTKMKGLLKHGAQCQIKATGGCNVCKRIWALLQIHARQCKATSCPVPNCMAIRERVRQLKKQQQAMDDRRRQEMNRAYARTF